MRKRMKSVAASLCAAAMLSVAVASPAAAQPVVQGGLINVSVGPITIEDVNVGVAANLAVAACVGDVNVAAVLAAIRDDGDFSCTIEGTTQTLTLEQD